MNRSVLAMPGEAALNSAPSLTIQSRLEDIARLWPWVESLAAEHVVPAGTLYAIHLCLEEALSNVIRHGYRGANDQFIKVECAPGAGELAFIIEDQAPAFNPLSAAVEDTPAPASIGDIPLGGQGIRLMRKFAGRLAYQRLPGGNRLTISFPTPR
jgi:anti-sigma regulatory factor (Ser/Thr protein kinase)